MCANPSSYLESEAPELTFADLIQSQPDADSTQIKNEHSVDPIESSLHDPTPGEQPSSFAITYEIAENRSKRGRPKLIDSQGYTYNQQTTRGLVTDWQCSTGPKSTHVEPQWHSMATRISQPEYHWSWPHQTVETCHEKSTFPVQRASWQSCHGLTTGSSNGKRIYVFHRREAWPWKETTSFL